MTEDGSCSRYVVVRKVSLRRRHFKGTLKKKKKKASRVEIGKTHSTQRKSSVQRPQDRNKHEVF